MEYEIERELREIKRRKPFLKRKWIGIPIFVFMLLGIGLITALTVWYATVSVDVSINEALSTTTTSISVSGVYPGETITKNIVVTNKADADLTTLVSWIELTNNPLDAEPLAYTTNMPLEVVLTSGENTIPITFTINGDSGIGVFTGEITLERIGATPIAMG